MKTVLITGANQGIGLQIAKDLAAHDFTVLVGSRNFERGVAAAKEVGPNAHAVQLDVTDRASIDGAADRISKEFGHLDVLINNAAISGQPAGMSLQEFAKVSLASIVSIDEVHTIWETNVFGVLYVTQAMLPLLRNSTEGRIVNVSSSLGSLNENSVKDHPYRKFFTPGYAASKTALNAMTLAFAIELEPEGIKVNAVSPGYTKTNLNGYEGTDTLEEGSREIVRVALQGPDSPTGKFTRWENVTIPW
jgi:NAD(P)-dependent dehydrogenase (short-subunit alcohol dehydrogenase family)